MSDPKEVEGTPERAADRGRQDDLGFPAGDRPSLGDLDVVRKLVSGFAGAIVGVRKEYNQDDLTPDAAQKRVRELAAQYGDIIMGRDAAYETMPWNDPGPGRLGSRIKRSVPAEDGVDDPGELLFLTVGTSLISLAAAHEDGRVTDHDAETQAREMLEDMANLITGNQ